MSRQINAFCVLWRGPDREVMLSQTHCNSGSLPWDSVIYTFCLLVGVTMEQRDAIVEKPLTRLRAKGPWRVGGI